MPRVQAYVWTVVGIFLYLAIVAAAALHVWNMKRTSDLEFEFGEYFPTHRLGYMVTVERGIWAMASFVIWFRLLKYAPSRRAAAVTSHLTAASGGPVAVMHDPRSSECLALYSGKRRRHLCAGPQWVPAGSALVPRLLCVELPATTRAADSS